MKDQDWLALGLLLAFLTGWFVACLPESQYQKRLEQELAQERELVQALAKQLARVQE